MVKPNKKKIKCLFICKQRVDSYGISFGLLNSASFIVNALEDLGIESKIVTVVDSNSTDREVAAFKPTHCFIEAIWVPSAKFEILCKLHPLVQFVVRIHSKIPFLAMEGIALEWIKAYAALQLKNLHVSANSKDLHKDLIDVLKIKSIFLPNIYMPVKGFSCNDFEVEYDNQIYREKVVDEKTKIVNIGCFGAIRPLKNNLIQAVAAMEFANGISRKLQFHVNGNRVEQDRAESILKNLRALFAGSGHEMVEHAWMPHSEFLNVVRSMDLGMQVSFSESFNIVAADFVASGVPIVASHDVDWLPSGSQADPNSTDDIANKLKRAWRGRSFGLESQNSKALNRHNEDATDEWKDYLL